LILKRIISNQILYEYRIKVNMQKSYNIEWFWVIDMYKKVRDLREDKDITQQKMAEYLNVTQATYSRYESGELDIPTSVLIKLAGYHKVSVDYLLGLTGNPKPYERNRE